MMDKFKDKRILVLYIIVGVCLLLGITYALSDPKVAFNVNTGIIKIDETAYGDNYFNASNVNFIPVLDSEVETNTDNVIKFNFSVGGAQNNNASNIIYDIALNDLNVHCNLLSPYIKWKLVKNGTSISTGSLDYKFDTIKDGRLVLTNTQQNLPSYSASKTGYDNYTFYLWLSDSCQSSLETCINNGQKVDQTNLLNKQLSGRIEVELYTKTKKSLVRKPRTTIDTSTCTNENLQLLNTKAVGSYVKYGGNNGCSGNKCYGENANYVNNSNKGWCTSSSYKFKGNGWRIAYIENGSAYLVSAGATECVNTAPGDTALSGSWTTTIGTNKYYYGSGYTYSPSTGKYTLTGVTSSTLDWSTDYQSIIDNTPYTLSDNTSTSYSNYSIIKIIGYKSSTQATTQIRTGGDTEAGVPNHLANLNNLALKYCNTSYAYNGICNNDSSWAMNATDFEKITGTPLSSCNSTSSDACGKSNDLISNGGYYWFNSPYSTNSGSAASYYGLGWYPSSSYAGTHYTSQTKGLRPVIKLNTSVIVSGGSGTIDDPYVIYPSVVKERPKKLSDALVGSYVAYTGNNGCSGESCSGQNANYGGNGNMGWCTSSSYKFKGNGWRIAYIENGSAYLVSAGATECVNTAPGDTALSGSWTTTIGTNKYYYGSGYTYNPSTGQYTLTGVTSSTLDWSTDYQSIIDNTPYTLSNNTSTSYSDYKITKITAYKSSTQATTQIRTGGDTAVGVPNHLTNLNNRALKYCNASYAHNGVCNSNSSWAMNATDFEKITGTPLSSCYSTSSDACGKSNDLISNGGYYWFNSPYRTTSGSTASYYGLGWYPSSSYAGTHYTSQTKGLRPVIKLKSNILITGGNGTMSVPYTISSSEIQERIRLSDVSVVGDYVAYTGNNGCSGNACKGENANYVDSSNKGYCDNSSYKYTTSGWRIAYIKDGKAHLVSAGAPECLARTSSTGNITYINTANASALKYCNSAYVDNGCTSADAWSMGDTDFYYTTKAINYGIGKRLTSDSSDLGDVGGNLGSTLFCLGYSSQTNCGYNNDLIDNGGIYWFAAQSSSSSSNGVYWFPYARSVYNFSHTDAYGQRPIISLSSSVYITGGLGTEDDPWRIAN